MRTKIRITGTCLFGQGQSFPEPVHDVKGGYLRSLSFQSVTLILVFASILFASAMACAQDSENMIKVGELGSGSPRDIVIRDNFAYVAASGIFSILDVSNPASPQQVAYVDTPDFAQGVSLSGNYAYVACSWGGLSVIDISNPYSPFEVASYGSIYAALSGQGDITEAIPVHDVYVSGNYAYVGTSGMTILDISDPTDPFKVGSLNYSTNSNDVFVSGNYVYLADGIYGSEYKKGLNIIDVSDPAAPVSVGYYDTSDRSYGEVYGVTVSGNYAYITLTGAMYVIDISDPASPVRVASMPGWKKRGIQVKGNYAYATDIEKGLYIYDISDPLNPIEVATSYTPGISYEVFVSGNYAYVASGEFGIRVIDVSNPEAPSEAGHTVSLGGLMEIEVSGNYAYVAGGPLDPITSGLFVVDIQNPAQPVVVGEEFFNYSTVSDQFLSGDYLYISDYDMGLRIVDISDPLNISDAGTYYGGFISVYVSGDYAYTTEYISGDSDHITIIDVSSPFTPSLVGVLDNAAYLIGDENGSGDYAYVSSGGFSTVDISDPSAPNIVNSIDVMTPYGVPVSTRGGTVSGNYAYLISNGALYIVDITNATDPVQVGTVEVSGNQVYVSGSYAYVAGGSKVSVVDVSNPESPEVVGYYTTPGSAWRLFVKGKNIYVVDDGFGLLVLEYDDGSLPVQTEWSPADGAIIKSDSPVIEVTTNEGADCRWSLEDQGYEMMANECAGTGSTSHSCSVSGLKAGDAVVYVSCRDLFGNSDTEDTNKRINYIYDITPPADLTYVYDGSDVDIDFSTDTAQLSANWPDSEDPETGVVSYLYAIGTVQGATDVVDWNDNEMETSITVTGLSLEIGKSYYITVKAQNGTGNFSNPVSSDGIFIMGIESGVEIPSHQWTAIGVCTGSVVIDTNPPGSLSAQFFELSNGKYRSVQNSVSEELERGKGMFVYGEVSAQFFVPDSAYGYSESEYSINLDEGWNMIANPFCYPINAGQENVNMTCGGTPVPPENMKLFIYNGQESKYETVLVDSDHTIQPFVGYFISVPQDECVLTISP